MLQQPRPTANKLDQVQNMANIANLQKTAGVEPLDSRRNAKLLTHGEKVKRMPYHLLHKRLQDLTKNKLKRISLNHVLNEQQRKQSDILAPRPEECEMLTHNRTPLVLKAEVKFSIPGISAKSSDSEASLKNTDTSRVGQKLPSHSLDTGLHRRIS